MKVSVIITTYNWPQALRQVLSALADQTYQEFEILIADDGSREETTQCIQAIQSNSSLSIQHIWQPDKGFRAAQIRNKAAAAARGDYLIFIDGDSLPLPNFVEHHLRLSEPGYWVAGNRILISQPLTEKILSDHIPIHRWSLGQFWLACRRHQINRFHSLLTLPLGILRKFRPHRWKNAKTCNLAVWRKDFIAINGFDESYEGWGYEDSDLVVRLLKAGIKRKSGHFSVPVLHLWHAESERNQEHKNYQKLMDVINSRSSPVTRGINQYTHRNL